MPLPVLASAMRSVSHASLWQMAIGLTVIILPVLMWSFSLPLLVWFMIMILLLIMARHAEVVKKAARLGHAAKCIFAGAPARVMLPPAEILREALLLHNRPLYQGVPHDTKVHQTRQNMSETHTPCEYSTGSPSSHFRQPWGVISATSP